MNRSFNRRGRRRKNARVFVLIGSLVVALFVLIQLPVQVEATPFPSNISGGTPRATAEGVLSHTTSLAATTVPQSQGTAGNDSTVDDYCSYDGAPCRVFVGAAFSGANASVTSVQFTMSIPNGTPVGNGGNDLYYLLDSIWDNGNSYDQIGIGDAKEYTSGSGPYYTSWTVFYSAWYVCTSQNPISWSNSAYTLTPGDQYTFRLVAHSNGTIAFDLYPGTNYFMPLWTAWVHTGGTSFQEPIFRGT